jgi:zinc finger MYND domain-containing protein 10
MPLSSLTPISHTSNTQFDCVENDISSSNIVSFVETQSIVSTLCSFPIDEIGSSRFLKMYGYDLERLSIQAHLSAKRQDGDEYVIEEILTQKKLSILVTTLLTLEAWRTLCLHPRGVAEKKDGKSALGEKIVKNQNSVRCAFILHAETTIVSIMNLICFRRENCEEMTSEIAVALIDYCARQLSVLATPVHENEMLRLQKEPGTIEAQARHIQSRSLFDEFYENLLGTEYRTSVTSTSLARYLCEHIDVLPLSAQSRILDTHDYLLMFVPLIDEPPWTRRRMKSKDGTVVWEKLYDNKEWKEVAPKDLIQITQCEAQCWIAVFYLTCSNVCRQNYSLNAFRKESLLRLRKFLNEVILDQLPVLTDVMRYMDELSLMHVPEASIAEGVNLLLQEVDTIRDKILKDWDLDGLSNKIFDSVFSNVTDSNDNDLRLIATIYDEMLVGELTSTKSMNHLSYAKPIEYVCLKVSRDVSFWLKPGCEKSILQSTYGTVTRSKLEIASNSKDFLFTEDMELVAVISFEGDCYSKELKASATFDGNSGKATHWIQLGNSSEMLVLQLGFKPQTENQSVFELHYAFLSQPL